MRQCRLLLPPVLGTLVLAACTSPSYTYGPASYATPPSMAPYQPVEIPLPRPSVSATPLQAPGAGLGSPLPGPLDTPLDPPPFGPGLSGPDPLNAPAPTPLEALPSAPPPSADPPAQVDPAPAAAAPSDPVTDLLLAPPSEQRDAPTAVVKKPSPPEANPLMGFRPMRGQTAPAP